MRTKLSITIGSIISAAVLHFILAACTTNGDASAATSCSSWSTAYFAYDITVTGGHPSDVPLNQIIGQTAMPAGWEPISVQWTGGGTNDLINLVTLRQCTAM
jgi:hypothetical protein